MLSRGRHLVVAFRAPAADVELAVGAECAHWVFIAELTGGRVLCSVLGLELTQLFLSRANLVLEMFERGEHFLALEVRLDVRQRGRLAALRTLLAARVNRETVHASLAECVITRKDLRFDQNSQTNR